MADSIWILIKVVCKYFLTIHPQQSPVDIAVLCHYYDAIIIPIDRYSLIDINSQSKQGLVALYAIIIILSSLGNISIMVLIIFNKKLRSAHGVLLISLAFSDLLITGKLTFSLLKNS